MKDREKFFFQIGILKVLFDGLDEKSQRIFLRSLNKNPWALVFKYPPLDEYELFDFERFEDYFMYQPIDSEQRLYFVDKASLLKVKRNVIVSLRNDFIRSPKWRN